MIVNRGLAKKWTGLMMPEHIERLKEWEKSIGAQYPKEKAEWEWEDLQHTIMKAFHKHIGVEVKLWRGKWITETGIITALHSGHKELLLDTEFSIKRIKFEEIDNVRVM